MPPRRRLPPELEGRPFHTATGIALGVSSSRLRGADLDRPFRGVRSAGAVDAALAYVPLLRPGDRFSHTTAAGLWPLPLPLLAADAIHVTATSPRNAPRSAGVRGHESGVDRAVLRNGLPLSNPACLFIELATVLGEDDLVAVGDALVLDPEILDPADLRPWISLGYLREACASSRLPGARLARRAAARVRAGAESPRETQLRLLLLAAGLPEPELNPVLLDSRGRRLGRFDLVYRTERVIVEYDGDQHRTSTKQYERDIVRIERAMAAGWTVVRVRARGLDEFPGATIARVAAALAR